jgi:hypothetical protein
MIATMRLAQSGATFRASALWQMPGPEQPLLRMTSSTDGPAQARFKLGSAMVFGGTYAACPVHRCSSSDRQRWLVETFYAILPMLAMILHGGGL